MDNQAFQLLIHRFDQQDKKFNDLESKVDSLLSRDSKLMGAFIVVSAVCGLVVQIIINKIGG